MLDAEILKAVPRKAKTIKLGTFLMAARVARKLTQRDLAELTGVNFTTISQIETGWIKNPQWWTIVAISKALQLDLQELAECKP